MNIRDLTYLVALVQHRHFGKAAEACFVSQPALSMQIKKLEAYLGVQLLERSNKAVFLTEIGALLATQAQTVLNHVDELKELAKLAKDPFSGELKVGIFPTLAPYLLPHIIPVLTQAFPKLSLYLMEEQTASLLEKLRQGKVDVLILALPVNETGLTTLPLFEEEFVLALPQSHALARKKIIKPGELEHSHLLLLEDGHCLREQALSFCHLMKASEVQRFRATSLETLRHMVAAKVGMTLMPRLACQANDGITYVPFSQPKPSRTIGLVWRNSVAKKKLLEEMARQIKKTMKKIKKVNVA